MRRKQLPKIRRRHEPSSHKTVPTKIIMLFRLLSLVSLLAAASGFQAALPLRSAPVQVSEAEERGRRGSFSLVC